MEPSYARSRSTLFSAAVTSSSSSSSPPSFGSSMRLHVIVVEVEEKIVENALFERASSPLLQTTDYRSSSTRVRRSRLQITPFQRRVQQQNLSQNSRNYVTDSAGNSFHDQGAGLLLEVTPASSSRERERERERERNGKKHTVVSCQKRDNSIFAARSTFMNRNSSHAEYDFKRREMSKFGLPTIWNRNRSMLISLILKMYFLKIDCRNSHFFS